MKSVLIVDDEIAYLKSLTDGLRFRFKDLEIYSAADGAEALAIMSRHPVDLLVTDLKMPDIDGFDLLDYIRVSHPETPVFIVSALVLNDVISKLPLFDSHNYFEKPVEFEVLAEKIGHELGCNGDCSH